jgi:hypothetical protein
LATDVLQAGRCFDLVYQWPQACGNAYSSARAAHRAGRHDAAHDREGTHVGIDRGQFADLTRIRDEEPGFPALAYSALSTVRFGAIKRGGNIATHRFQALLEAAFILLISRHFRGAALTRRSKNCALQ